MVGIALGLLRKLGQANRGKVVWAGVLAATVVSVVVGVALNALGVAFEGRGEEVYEGVTMLLAGAVLTWMIFWMQRQGRQVQEGLEAEVREAVSAGSAWALFGLAFVAVVREGVETALFLTAAGSSASPMQLLVGGILGLLIAVVLGWLVFAAGKRLDIRAFFRATGALLILFAAGLVARGVHEFQEGSVLPVIVEHIWDINHVLDEQGGLGVFLKALFGYNGNPSLLEVAAYILYFAVVGLAIWKQRKTQAPIP
jgi:high-affinity iron transporter